MRKSTVHRDESADRGAVACLVYRGRQFLRRALSSPYFVARLMTSPKKPNIFLSCPNEGRECSLTDADRDQRLSRRSSKQRVQSEVQIT
jgi:hypothetical protein